MYTLRICIGDPTQINSGNSNFLKNPQMAFFPLYVSSMVPNGLEISGMKTYDISSFKRTFERPHTLFRSKVTLL